MPNLLEQILSSNAVRVCAIIIVFATLVFAVFYQAGYKSGKDKAILENSQKFGDDL